ncbi:MAG: hypothetical protein PHY69_10335 [Dysgonamonadaceae bacterium]|nr:hypothetical protein [Dysgonamonadaceae bacterium]MDD3310340.1 hypothetical protein [Dysgonamonadaceae bacterium]MDD4399341.1 hypothetical protein [Dysgonamonadaceae bacterium]
MRKIFIISILLLNTAFIFAQEHTFFKDYISNFKTIQLDTFNNFDFKSGIVKGLSPDYINNFIPSVDDEKCDKDVLWYLYTSKIEEEDFFIVIVTKSCEAALSYEEKLLITYSKDGKLIDFSTVANKKNGSFYNYIGTLRPFKLQVKQASVVSENMRRYKSPYPCKFDTYQYMINSKGKIEKKQIGKTEQGIVIWNNEKEGMEIVKDSNMHIYNAYAALSEKNATFENYISNFKLNITDTINNTYFRRQDQIIGDFIMRFITNKPDCECLNEGLWYRYMSKIENEDFVITFVSKDCDIPSSLGNYPYSDVILLVYSKKGEILDSKVISRGGDLWYCNYRGSNHPFKLIVEQASVPQMELEKRKNSPLPCEIKTYVYLITEKGKIEQKIISDEKGTILWDKKNNKSLIVKNSN